MNRNDIDYAISHYAYILDTATPEQKVMASTWYNEANAIALNMSLMCGLSVEKCASIIAAFSPRERWASNVKYAHQFINGGTPPTLTNNINMAYAAMVHGFNALNGRKTNAFARNIAGDKDAVTIDVWMIRAAGMDANKGVNDTEYRILAEVVKELAANRGMYPATAQALIWIIVRGDAK
jgi:hypothetical protein